MRQNIEALLFKSGLSGNKIANESGVPQSTVSRFLTGESKLDNMKLSTVESLNEYYNKIKGDIKMKKVYELLEQAVNVDEMSADGKYLVYHESPEVLAEEFGLEDDPEGFSERFYDEFGIDVEEVEGTSFIALDDSGSVGGNVYVDAEQAFEDITNFMLSESSYKKYVDRDKVKEIRGY